MIRKPLPKPPSLRRVEPTPQDHAVAVGWADLFPQAPPQPKPLPTPPTRPQSKPLPTPEQAKTKREANTKAANSNAIASFKTNGRDFASLTDAGRLTAASTAKLDAALDEAVASHPSKLTGPELKKIAEDEVGKLALAQEKSKQDNLIGAAEFKSTGTSFATLTGHDELTLGQKRVFNQNLENLVGSHASVSDRPLSAEEIKQVAQQALTAAKTAQVTNLSGNHFVQEQQNSCVVAS
jgi:hypothetical protein